MRYRKRRKWKYLTEDPEQFVVGDNFPDVEFGFLKVENGVLHIQPKYAWDGASGPTIDTRNTMTPSLVHDAFYQLMREGVYPVSVKPYADRLFYEMLKERRMWFARARLWYRAVVVGGPTSSYVLEAP